jgi:hypothetical protein
MNTENRILVAMDVSNFEYVTINAAFNKWRELYLEDSNHILSPKETDQNNLPNILNIDSFRKILSVTTQQKLDSLNWIIRNNHQNDHNDNCRFRPSDNHNTMSSHTDISD